MLLSAEDRSEKGFDLVRLFFVRFVRRVVFRRLGGRFGELFRFETLFRFLAQAFFFLAFEI